MNRINRIDIHIQRLKILIARRKKIGNSVKGELEKIEHLKRCRIGQHVFVYSIADTDEFCKHCNLDKIEKKREEIF